MAKTGNIVLSVAGLTVLAEGLWTYGLPGAADFGEWPLASPSGGEGGSADPGGPLRLWPQSSGSLAIFMRC